jgi:F-type H+-transporting ATPase subunit b
MHRSLILALATGLLAAFFLASPGLARQEGAHGKTKQPAAADAKQEGHGGEGKEKPDIFGQALDLGIWTLVVFLLLLLVLTKYAWKPMLEGLKRREESIRSALDEAQRAREEAKTLQARFEQEMNRAQEKVREVMDEARRDAQNMKDEMIARAKSEIQTERERLRHEIEMARDQALQQIWSQSAQLATLISAKVIRRQLNVEDHRHLVDEAIADLRRAANERQREVASIRS